MKFFALTSLIILATSVVQAETEEEREEREGNEEYLKSDKRKEDFKEMDAKYLEDMAKNELML
jgi:YHS domain-containing protein